MAIHSQTTIVTELASRGKLPKGVIAVAQALYDLSGDLVGIESLLNTINGDNTTEGSFRKIVKDSIDGLVGNAPDLLDTLEELANALQNDENAYNSLTQAISKVKTDLINGEVEFPDFKKVGDELRTLKATALKTGNLSAQINAEEKFVLSQKTESIFMNVARIYDTADLTGDYDEFDVVADAGDSTGKTLVIDGQIDGTHQGKYAVVFAEFIPTT
jgi:hypothetical protein